MAYGKPPNNTKKRKVKKNRPKTAKKAKEITPKKDKMKPE